MNQQERKHFEEVMSALSPVLGQLMKKAVLDALRQHHTDTGADKLLDLSLQRIGQAQPMGPTRPTTEEFLNLVGEFDATKWAEMFIRTDPPRDIDTMRGWFANAIMAGYDHAKKEEREKLKCMQDCLDVQGSDGNWNIDYYMQGMFNGMEHMMAIMEEREPQFRSWPKDKQVQPTTAEVYFGPLANRPKTTEVPGEREVWAQAYRAGIIAHKSPENCGLCADIAVKAFRERYK